MCGCTGRTGRAGRPGKAVTFYTEEDIVNLRRYAARPFLLLSLSLEKQTNDKKEKHGLAIRETNIDVYKVLTTSFPATILEFHVSSQYCYKCE